MSAAQRQEVASSAAGAVEQAVLRSLGVLDERARAFARQQSAAEAPVSPGVLPRPPKKSSDYSILKDVGG